MSEAPGSSKRQVVAAGGGIAGLESLVALHDLAKDRVEFTLVSPDAELTCKLFIVEEPSSLAPAESHALVPPGRSSGLASLGRVS